MYKAAGPSMVALHISSVLGREESKEATCTSRLPYSSQVYWLTTLPCPSAVITL